MLNTKKQINKMGVKKQVKKVPVKKKIVSKQFVWECLTCQKKIISIDKPIACPCSLPNYVVNKSYEVV